MESFPKSLRSVDSLTEGSEYNATMACFDGYRHTAPENDYQNDSQYNHCYWDYPF
jgi:hypothetical protein